MPPAVPPCGAPVYKQFFKFEGTQEELEEENREVFIEAGGESYHYIPALNDCHDHIKAIVSLIETNIHSAN